MGHGGEFQQNVHWRREWQTTSGNAGDSSWIPGLGRSSGEGTGYPLQYSLASLVAQTVKNLPAIQETSIMQNTPVFLPGESHGQRSLMDYSPRGRRRVGTQLSD